MHEPDGIRTDPPGLLAIRLAQEEESRAAPGPAECAASAFRRVDGLLAARAGCAAWACRRGCTFCCHLRVEVTAPEALLIARRVEGLAPTRRRIAEQAGAAAGLTPSGHRRRRLRCALLDDAGDCLAYDVRPLRCRAHASLAVGDCEAAFLDGGKAFAIPLDSWAIRVVEAVHAGMGPEPLEELHDALQRVLVPEPIGGAEAGGRLPACERAQAARASEGQGGGTGGRRRPGTGGRMTTEAGGRNHGFLVLDKPKGMTSARALDGLRARTGRRARVGHAGTLDPFASGVLLALVGDGTRLSALAMGLPKRYQATILFGVQTDTLDPEGSVVASADPGPEPPEALAGVLERLTGRILQRPPAYSALKVGGRRAYALAREGEAVSPAPREVLVHALRLVTTDWPRIDIDLTCGAGTYVRALARDIGGALGLPAHLTALRRTAVGPFDASSGVAPVEADPLDCRPLLDLVRAAGMRPLVLPANAALGFAQGRVVAGPGGGRNGERVAVVAERPAGLVVGLGVCEGGGVHAETVLAAARRVLEAGRDSHPLS